MTVRVKGEFRNVNFSDVCPNRIHAVTAAKNTSAVNIHTVHIHCPAPILRRVERSFASRCCNSDKPAAGWDPVVSAGFLPCQKRQLCRSSGDLPSVSVLILRFFRSCDRFEITGQPHNRLICCLQDERKDTKKNTELSFRPEKLCLFALFRSRTVILLRLRRWE